MIEIEPQFLKDLDEFAAAESLKEKLIEQYPELESSKEKMIKMIRFVRWKTKSKNYKLI